MKSVIVLLMLAVFPFPVLADWELEANSEIQFISVKKGQIAEVHRFTELSGGIDANGLAQLNISLDSVDTGIPIRDERMRKMLFDTLDFPQAILKVQLAKESYADLAAGESVSQSVEAELVLHGISNRVKAELLITGLADGKLLIVSAKPVLINAADFKLSEGVERLREVVGLSSISLAVPVTFQLIFER